VFTGIIEALSSVRAVSDAAGVRQLVVEAPFDFATSIAAGDSVSVNGVCLTRVNAASSDSLQFDVVQETLSRSNLGAVQQGDRVNLERALRFGERLGGHLLAGHVWSTETCLAIEQQDENRLVWFSLAAMHVPYVLHKGFVALDGVSLTVARIERGEGGSKFAVTLIPETRQRTRLGEICEGDHVNLEVDAQAQAIVDTVTRVLAEMPENIAGQIASKS